MSGYFSQLAHHTGLSFDPGPPQGASAFASEPTVGGETSDGTALDAMHVEEFSFTAAPAPDSAERRSEHPQSSTDSDRAETGTADVRVRERTESKEGDHVHGGEAKTKGSTEVSSAAFREEPSIAFTSSTSATKKPPENSVVEIFPASERPARLPNAESGAEPRILSQESIAIPYDSTESRERHSPARDREDQRLPSPGFGAKDARRPAPIGDRSAGAPIHEQHVERETIVRNYLKEMRAWVSVPPELDQREPEWQRDADRSPERQGAERSPVGLSDVFALEPEVQATPRPARSESLEVQDLNLSIGTISIVIEEPKQIAAASVPPPTRIESVARPASEPTRLSRYYLERW